MATAVIGFALSQGAGAIVSGLWTAGAFLGSGAAYEAAYYGLSYGGSALSLLGGRGGSGGNVVSSGPRLGDLKVTSAAYGRPIPMVYGAYRIAGEMIWSRPILETRHKNKVSGGKGGKKKATQISYTYSQSFAIALCEGPIIGVRKIWANGELIYNNADDATAEAIAASNQNISGMRIYLGDEAQTANSLIEADQGAGNVPAYRGMAYIVFDALQLAKYGNRTPNIEAEVVAGGSSESLVDVALSTVAGSPFSAYKFPVCVGGTRWGRGSAVYRSDIHTGIIDVTLSNWTDPDTGTVYTASVQAGTGDINGAPFLLASDSAHTLLRWDGGRLVAVGPTTSLSGSVFELPGGTVYWSNSGPVYTTDAESGYRQAWTFPAGYSGGTDCNSRYIDGIYKILTLSADSTRWLARASLTGGTEILAQLSVNDLFIFGGSDGYLYFWDGTLLSQYNQSGTLLATLALSISGYGLSWCEPEAGKVVLTYSGQPYCLVDTVNMVELSVGSGSSTVVLIPNCALDGICYGYTSTGNALYLVNYRGAITGSAVAVADTVEAICVRAGLDSGDLDVTDLADSLTGYAVTRGTARSHLQQLMQAYFFDAVESNGQIKFVTRGGAAVASIAEDDLAAHDAGSAPPAALSRRRAQDMELPLEIAIGYPDTGNAGQVNTQTARRLTTDSENQQALQLAIAMSATKAKQIADVLLYDAWTARAAMDFATGWKYAHLEPTDVVTVTAAGRTYTARITDEEGAGGIWRRSAVQEDSAVYTQTAAAAETIAPDDALAPVPRTLINLLDIPLLRDQDDAVGFYAAAAGSNSTWRGAELYKSTDAGASWVEYSSFLNDATLGRALTALGDFTQNIFDESNTVSVILHSGSGLSSDTEINVLNGANVALLGDEIIQWKTATLTATDTYTLSGLLRGRRGTEWARSTHVVNERFVLLDTTSTYLLESPLTNLDIEHHYRAVTFDNYLESAETIKFTDTGVARMPYAPVLIGGGRDASLNLTINWVRRGRLSADWNNYADIPVGEDSEAYEVEIYSSSAYTTLKRTITGLTSATTPYTAAEQTTDFGGTQSTVYCKVFQLSAVVGRGYEARGVI